ncbi:MAG: hypothetical protein HDR17_13230 [Lachnospiraceae bacterium]|nr:hypothetical protein [Lachnospiraceae bacterium]
MDMTMNGKVNAAIFGLGRMFEKFMDIYDSQKVNIVCLCDNNVKSMGSDQIRDKSCKSYGAGKGGD